MLSWATPLPLLSPQKQSINYTSRTNHQRTPPHHWSFSVTACASKETATQSESQKATTPSVSAPPTNPKGDRIGRIDQTKLQKAATKEALDGLWDGMDDSWMRDDWEEDGWEQRVGFADERGRTLDFDESYLKRFGVTTDEGLPQKEKEGGKKDGKIPAGELRPDMREAGSLGVINWTVALQQQVMMARGFWKEVVSYDDVVVDATCGNGKDSVELLKLLRREGGKKLVCVDVQEEAVQNTKGLLQDEWKGDVDIEYYQQSHETFPESLKQSTVALVVYNLGYLPGGDDGTITRPDATIKSLDAAIALLRPLGMISLMLYEGHEGGKEEKERILEWARQLDSAMWNACHFDWSNRQKAPSLLLIRKMMP